MSVSVNTLVQLTRRRLHEANNSPIGEMASGTSGAATVSAENGIIEALNRVASEICRTCFYYEARGNLSTIARTLDLADLLSMDPASTVIWGPLWVTQGVPLTPLQYVNAGTAPASMYLTNTTGTPQYWEMPGEGYIQVMPNPLISVLITVRGAALPPVMVSGGEVGFLSDELLQKMLPAGAASRIAMAEADNPALATRGPIWQAEYDLDRLRLWERIPLMIRNRLYPSPPGGMA